MTRAKIQRKSERDELEVASCIRTYEVHLARHVFNRRERRKSSSYRSSARITDDQKSDVLQFERRGRHSCTKRTRYHENRGAAFGRPHTRSDFSHHWSIFFPPYWQTCTALSDRLIQCNTCLHCESESHNMRLNASNITIVLL